MSDEGESAGQGWPADDDPTLSLFWMIALAVVVAWVWLERGYFFGG